MCTNLGVTENFYVKLCRFLDNFTTFFKIQFALFKNRYFIFTQLDVEWFALFGIPIAMCMFQINASLIPSLRRSRFNADTSHRAHERQGLTCHDLVWCVRLPNPSSAPIPFRKCNRRH